MLLSYHHILLKRISVLIRANNIIGYITSGQTSQFENKVQIRLQIVISTWLVRILFKSFQRANDNPSVEKEEGNRSLRKNLIVGLQLNHIKLNNPHIDNTHNTQAYKCCR